MFFKGVVYKAVLFDCDGTLLDTQYLYDLAVSAVLSKFDQKFTPEFCINHFDGKSWDQVFRDLRSENPDIPDVAFEIAVNVGGSLVREYAKTNSGVPEVLSKLKTLGIKMAVCSNGNFSDVVESLKWAGILEYFGEENVVTRDKCREGKPHPEIYLTAAYKLQCKQNECLVVEDSITGATAASAAEMDLIGYTGGSHSVYHYNLNSKMHDICQTRLLSIESDFRKVFDHVYRSYKYEIAG